MKKNLYIIISLILGFAVYSFATINSNIDFVDINKTMLYKKSNQSGQGVQLGDPRLDVISILGNPTSQFVSYSEVDDKPIVISKYGVHTTLYFMDDELVEVDIEDFNAGPFTVGSPQVKLASASIGVTFQSLYGALKGNTTSGYTLLSEGEAIDAGIQFYYSSTNNTISVMHGIHIRYSP